MAKPSRQRSSADQSTPQPASTETAEEALLRRLAQSTHPGASVCYLEGLSLPPAPTQTRYLLRNNLGYCLNEAHCHAEAEGHCRAAIAIDPQRHNAHKNLGVALEGQGRCAEAVAAYVQAVHNNPHDARALQHLERMVAAHPALADAMTGLAATLQACRERVLAARRENTAGPRPKLSG